ncbi:MAG: flagellar protein FlaG [Lachnospiraceae bacterium]|nr:flagellar protein FlaG [Lachnospiraceae bacterium]
MEVKASSAVNYAGQGSYVSQPDTPIKSITETPDISKEIVTPKSNDVTSKENDTENTSKEASQEQIQKAVSEINRAASGTVAQFGIHDKTNRVTIKIVDKETQKVIKELPPEKTLDLIAKAWEMAGILVDEKR